MRADLQTMEQIDLYLQGKMSATESSLFESSMAQNPELSAMVQDQQLLIQMVNRKAMLAEINAVVGGGSVAWYANPYITFGGLGLLVAAVVTLVYVNSEVSSEAPIIAETEIKVNDNNSIDQPEMAETVLFVDSISVDENDDRKNKKNSSENMNSILPDEPENYHKKNVVMVDAKDYGTNDVIKENTNNAGVNAGDVRVKKVKNKKAKFPKGDIAMTDFASNNLVYPRTALDKQLQGNVRVKFLVDNQGLISEIAPDCFNLRDVNDKPLNAGQMILNQKIIKLFENKAEQFVRIMPAWEPATDSQGNPILSVVTLYFNFSLTDGIVVYQITETDKSELMD